MTLRPKPQEEIASSELPELPELPAGVERHLPVAASEAASTEPCSDPSKLARAVEADAHELGFCRLGFASAERLERGGAALRSWVEAGYHGSMDYLAEPFRDEPERLLRGACTVVCAAMAYPNAPSDPAIARYARGESYQSLIKRQLRALADRIAARTGRAILARACVDTAPLLERELAAAAGLGFIGKSGMLIVPGLGTNVLLGALLLDGPKLRTTTASTTSSSAPRCGRCTACMDRCPTRAFVAPYVLDARRCISYLTIEHAGPIPRELRPLLGHRVFGCDVCQDVCPYNRTPRARQGVPELATRPAIASLGLVELLELGSKAHRRLSRDSAFERISRNRLARNAAIALGNSGHAEAAAPLARALSHHVSSLVRSHAAWALGELPAAADAVACPALAEAGENDPDVEVREEAGAALGKRRGTAGTT